MNGLQEKRVYILDTNVLIEFYIWIPISLNKTFWDGLEEALKEDEWILLDVVVDEIRHTPELEKWCERQKRNGLVKRIEDRNRERAIEINNTYKMIDESNGNSTTDTYIIAYAEENKLSIFSRESFRIKENGLFKILEVCQRLNIVTIKRPVKFLESISFKN